MVIMQKNDGSATGKLDALRPKSMACSKYFFATYGTKKLFYGFFEDYLPTHPNILDIEQSNIVRFDQLMNRNWPF